MKSGIIDQIVLPEAQICLHFLNALSGVIHTSIKNMPMFFNRSSIWNYQENWYLLF